MGETVNQTCVAPDHEKLTCGPHRNGYNEGVKKTASPANVSVPRRVKADTPLLLPFYEVKVPAGFPSPAEGLPAEQLDLVSYLVRNPAATFFLRVSGDSMIEAGIFDGDLLLVDRSLEPKSGDIVIAVLDGEFTVKRLLLKNGRVELRPENREFRIIRVPQGAELDIWGVVTNVIRSV